MAIQKGEIKGFTLIELSIVIIIIGFLIAGISTGTQLIREAKMHHIVNDFNNISIAFKTFKSVYGAAPGDITNATIIWPLASTADGDGNGLVDYGGPQDEETYVFQQLSLAGFIPGAYVGGPTAALGVDPRY